MAGLVSSLIVTVITAIVGVIAFFAGFVKDFFSAAMALHALVTLLSLGSGFGLFLGASLINLTAGAAALTVETLLGYVKGFFCVILVFTYIYLVNGLVRYIFAYKDTWQDRIKLLIPALIPNVNLILGIVLLIKTGKRIKDMRRPVPDVISVQAQEIREAPDTGGSSETSERNDT